MSRSKLHDQFASLRRIGIDEISYKRGHKYLAVVVDHDSGWLVWAAPGQDKATLGKFFDALGVERCSRITHVSADGAAWNDARKAARASEARRGRCRPAKDAAPPRTVPAQPV
ncbi:transposase [Arthrobacter sp. UYEF21]